MANVTATPGSLGSFDVIVSNTNALGGASYTIAGDVLTLQLVGTSGVSFTGASISTASPYNYSATSTGPGSPYNTSPIPATKLTVSDADLDPTTIFARVIAPGQVYGLAHVSYQVASNATPGKIAVIASQTVFYIPNFSAVAFTTVSGTITLAGAVPDPASIVLMGMGLIPLARRARGGRTAQRGEGR